MEESVGLAGPHCFELRCVQLRQDIVGHKAGLSE